MGSPSQEYTIHMTATLSKENGGARQMQMTFIHYPRSMKTKQMLGKEKRKQNFCQSKHLKGTNVQLRIYLPYFSLSYVVVYRVILR